MTHNMHQQFLAYERAVRLSGETYKGMSGAERSFRSIAARDLEEHSPSDQNTPTCAGCDGAAWPCDTARGAMSLADPHTN
ncbi:hypothetical protein [Streptomyces sp. NPDC007346]|uniref:hypothetical protein n=1 Tax=Streptomyces sp. NPDC007346 TaxID=3154682 RepID=UPI0034559CE5